MAVQCLQRTSHITIQKSTEVPVAVHKAGKLFHCPFCNETQFKPARKDKVEDHLEGHHNRAVIVEDLTIHRCGLGCKKMLHYHCPYCPGEILKRKDFLNHLQKCKKKCYSSLERIPPLPLSARAPPLPLLSDQTAAPVFASPAAPASSLSLVSGPAPAPLLKYVITSNTTPSLATGTPPPAADSKKTTATLTNAALKGTPAALCPKKRVRQRAVIHKRCPFCEILINKCNLKRHIERKHTKEKNQDINASCHLAGEIIDQENGIYAVLKVFQGDSMHILCEHIQCQITTDAAQQSGLSNYLCQHIRSGTYITSSAQAESLSPDVLDEMIKAKWFGQEAKTDCLKRQELAYNSKAPLSVHTIGIPETKKCISVYEPTISHYSGSGRVMVVYDTMRNRWTCPCTNQRRSCIHTYIAKWHLFQTQHELFCTEEVVIENTEGQYDCSAGHKSDEDSSPVYPSTGATCQEMVSYIQNIKEIPAILPEDTRHPVPNRDYPFETLCQKCVGTVPLSDPVITKNDKLSNCCVIEEVATSCKYCPQCGMCSRCQEWKNGVHNFDDRIIMSLPLGLTWRNILQGSVNIEVSPPPSGLEAEYETLFTTDSLFFLHELISTFDEEVDQSLWLRVARKANLELSGHLPGFLEETIHIRGDPTWRVLPVPPRLQRRHVDIGDLAPCNSQCFAKALKSPAQGIQVDFDDGNCPTYYNQIKGIHNVFKAVHNQFPDVPHISQAPVLMLRPRAWNMVEHNMMVEGKEAPGPLFDFGLLMFHCGKTLFENKSGPFFYLSKIESFMEARLWNKIFVWTQQKLGLPIGSIKATVLIENILAAFEMEEILYELRDHSAGLNCGVWDYSASIVNKFGHRLAFLLPDRSKYVNIETRFLRSYMDLLIQTCHRRGALATGGMSALLLPQDPLSESHRTVLATVTRLKLIEIKAGVDGFMVYDVNLIEPMQTLFKLHTEGDNQLHQLRNDVTVTPDDLLSIPLGGITLDGLKYNIAVGVLFINAWLSGEGVFFYRGSVEDSATAEISRSQVWQWIRHHSQLEDDSRVVSRQLVTDLLKEVMVELSSRCHSLRDKQRLLTAADMFLEMVLKRDFPEFITTYLNEDHTFLSCQSTRQAAALDRHVHRSNL